MTNFYPSYEEINPVKSIKLDIHLLGFRNKKMGQLNNCPIYI